MDYSNTMAVGFFTGICFMATVVVILTAFYFSDPRLRNGGAKTRKASAQGAKTSAPRKVKSSAKMPSLLRRIRFWRLGKVPGRQPKQVDGQGQAITPAAQKIKPQVAAPTAETKGPGSEKNLLPVGPSAQKVENTPKAGEAKPEPNNRPVGPSITILNQNSGKNETEDKAKSRENKAGTPGESTTPSAHTADQKSGVVDVSQEAKTKEAKSEANNKPVDQLVKADQTAKIVNEKTGAGNMDNKTTEKSEKSETASKPKAADTSDFSGLFTDEDIEENESDRLAKEMSDIESKDILEQSRDLISQFKRR